MLAYARSYILACNMRDSNKQWQQKILEFVAEKKAAILALQLLFYSRNFVCIMFLSAAARRICRRPANIDGARCSSVHVFAQFKAILRIKNGRCRPAAIASQARALGFFAR